MGARKTKINLKNTFNEYISGEIKLKLYQQIGVIFLVWVFLECAIFWYIGAIFSICDCAVLRFSCKENEQKGVFDSNDFIVFVGDDG